MSYDIQLVIDTGGEFPASLTENYSPTYNLAPMFVLALGCGLRELDGMLAVTCIPLLRKAIAEMEDRPSEFKKLNPPIGWGDYDCALEFFRSLLKDCINHPKATVTA